MNKRIGTAWVKALRSGRYEQGHNSLVSKDGKRYCCLGVLCKINNKFREWGDGGGFMLNYTALNKIGLTSEHQTELTKMNDGFGGINEHTFPQIADYIEKELL